MTTRRLQDQNQAIKALQREVRDLQARLGRIGGIGDGTRTGGYVLAIYDGVPTWRNIPGGFRRERSTSQNIPDSSATSVNFDSFVFTEVSDFLEWDSTNVRFNVLRDCTVVAAASVRWATNATGSRRLWVTVNNFAQGESRVPAVSGDFTSQSVPTGPIQVSSGDWIDAKVQQTSGGVLAVQGTSASAMAMQVISDRG